jgi:peptidoglycan/xylan/chitin deacetylase (PgdA/CDA1 family)
MRAGSEDRAAARVACVSVDLDEIHHYAAIHGLAPPALERASEQRLACTVGLERALAWAKDQHVPLTLFVVASDLDDERVRSRLSRALDEGHEVASHSLTHPYDLVHRGAAELEREVSGSFEHIAARLGVRPVGFRAPGYLVSAGLFDALERTGASYDASILSAPMYDLAKMAAMGSMRLAGRVSRASLGELGVWRAPTAPYRPGRSPYTRGGRSFVELPMTVTRAARLPILGTSLGLAGPRLAPRLVRAAGRPRCFSLELHAIDFLGEGDGLGALRGHQPELLRPLATRLAALDAARLELRREGYRSSTLGEVAASLEAELG